MDAEEARLRFALLAAAPDGRRGFAVEAMRQAILSIPGMRTNDFTVRPFAPESFLIVFASQHARDAVLSTNSVRVDNAELMFRPWTRLVRASHRPLRQRVSLEIEGIPAHAWSLRVARKLLASSCWIERIEPTSEDHSDMAFMALTAWTDNPSAIPRRMYLAIAEHERPVIHEDPETERIFANTRPYLRDKMAFQYEVFIHLRRIADFSSGSPSPSPGSSPQSSDGDSGHDGNPDRGYGESHGDGGPKLHGFPAIYGRQDGAPAPDGRAGGQTGGQRRLHGAGRRRHVRSASLPPVGCRSPSPAASPTASPTRGASPVASAPSLSGSGDPTDKVAATAAKVQRSPLADATKPPYPVGRTSLSPPASQLSPCQASPTSQTNGSGSSFLKEATDKRTATAELIPCELDLSVERVMERDQAPDPMLFEFRASVPARCLQKLPDATREGLRTYRRRPRSVAVTACSEATLQLPLEPAERSEPPATDGPQSNKRPRGPVNGNEPTPGKQARLQLGPELEEAKAATAAFLASLSRALQAPLAALPSRPAPLSPATAPRRSSRLANKPLNATVRPSKKGEVLVLRKLGFNPGNENTDEVRQQLAAVFHGPLELPHYESLRDIFPAARALSDAELMAAAAQASQAVCAC
ncbi:unnamed protein product [Urochloa humidicola]